MKRKIIIGILILAALGIASILICDWMVAYAAKDRLYDNVENVPHRKVGLVLGTSPISTWNGRRNYYFDHRIKAASELYKAGKVDWLVVSGGDYRNTENGYDEPVAMRDSLMKQGVDSAHIVLDYDGTRTLNSIAKMRDVYRHDSIIIISQKYHNERALYQAKHLGIDGIGFNAKTPGRRTSWWRNRGREVLARVKLFVDILRDKQPDIKESLVSDFTETKQDLLSESHIETPYGDLICLKPDMGKLQMDMGCGEIPSA
ncbi:MAG: YdcF family protein, partial [Paramuribaculum sp.]|nr:YdcF family protein [Paramuribaculum sp.]